MALHPDFPRSPYATLPPDLRWFPAAEELRSTAYEKLLPPLVAKVREGIDLVPKYIPAEVFDKRAVDKGQVVFHDVSFVEATPRYEKKNKLAVRIELTDFSVYYTQGAAEAAIAAMKEGKSEVMCEQGQLYKVSKSKDGIVKKDRLTKHWTDWVDYWAVDFDYMSRKEIIKVPVETGLGAVASLPGIEPVSYTHLDVYKRQAFPHEASSERENCAVTIFRAVPIVVPAEDGNRTWSVSPGKGIGKPFGVFSG